MATPPNYTTHSENLTPSETDKYYATLDDLKDDYPEVDLTPCLHKSIKKKIVDARTPPKIMSVPSHHTPDDDGGSSYSGSASTSRKQNKVKLRPRFSEKVIWDGRRTTFKPLNK